MNNEMQMMQRAQAELTSAQAEVASLSPFASASRAERAMSRLAAAQEAYRSAKRMARAA